MKPRTAFRESQRSYITVNEALAPLENIDPAILGLASSGMMVYANRSACKLLGYLKAELEGRALETIAPEMTAEAWSNFWSELNQADFKKVRAALRRSGKRKFSVEFWALFNHQQGLKYCMLTRARKRLMTADNGGTPSAPLVHVLNSVAETIIVLDEQHKITFQNQAACRSLGTTVANALGKTVYDYLPKRQADIGWEHEQDALDTTLPSTREADGFIRAKYGASVTMLPILAIGTSQKQLLAITNRPAQAVEADPAPRDIPEIHRSVPRPIRSDYLSKLNEIMDRSGSLGIYLKNVDNRILWVNEAFARMTGLEIRDFLDQRVGDLISDPEIKATLREQDNYVYATGKPVLNFMIPRFNNQSGYYRLDKLPFINRTGELTGIIGLVVEIDERPPPPEALKEELASTSKKLSETETALRVLLERRQQDVSLTREQLSAKVRDQILPCLEHLKKTQFRPEQSEFVELIETNLKNFYDPAYARLSSPSCNLSPTELKVAQLIRDGKTNKEIAKLLHLSKSTILTHRHHVRVKLGIKNKKVNLRSQINS